MKGNISYLEDSEKEGHLDEFLKLVANDLCHQINRAYVKRKEEPPLKIVNMITPEKPK